MDNQPTLTPQDALKYYLNNQQSIDLPGLLRDFAVSEPDNFLSFLSDLTGKTTTQVASGIIKQRPEAFMRFATGGQVKFKAAQEVIGYLKTKPIEKVLAIKKIRVAWGLGLKEAKDVADLLHQELAKTGAQAPYSGTVNVSHLDPHVCAAFNYIEQHL